MADLMGFDANQVAPNEGYSILPAGDYPAVIVASEMKPNKRRNGRFLALTLQVLHGQYQNRKLFENLNIDNPSAEAVKIARGTLSAICRAVGVMTPRDSSELHNRPMVVTVKVKRDSDSNPENRITKYAPMVTQAGAAPYPPPVTGQLLPPSPQQALPAQSTPQQPAPSLGQPGGQPW